MITVYVNAQQPEEAFLLFEEVLEHGFQHDSIIYDILINACEEVETALWLLQGMKEQGVLPGVCTYNTLIAVNLKCNRWAEADNFFEEMKAQGLKPDVTTHNILLSPCENGRESEKAFQFLEDIKRD
jgi:pentatricopeptide repeat protein